MSGDMILVCISSLYTADSRPSPVEPSLTFRAQKRPSTSSDTNLKPAQVPKTKAGASRADSEQPQPSIAQPALQGNDAEEVLQIVDIRIDIDENHSYEVKFKRPVALSEPHAWSLTDNTSVLASQCIGAKATLCSACLEPVDKANAIKCPNEATLCDRFYHPACLETGRGVLLSAKHMCPLCQVCLKCKEKHDGSNEVRCGICQARNNINLIFYAYTYHDSEYEKCFWLMISH